MKERRLTNEPTLPHDQTIYRLLILESYRNMSCHNAAKLPEPKGRRIQKRDTHMGAGMLDETNPTGGAEIGLAFAVAAARPH